MSVRQPDGAPAPADGALGAAARAAVGLAPLGVYVHVPFCLTRCGYCDFNTYTTGDRGAFVAAALAEVALAGRVLSADGPPPPVQTVFLGGGTPTLLTPDEIGSLLEAIDARIGLSADVEITVEANPDTVDLAFLARLRAGGVTRVSFGVQSAVPHVLAVLERLHDPARALDVIAAATTLGFDGVSADLIYGTPSEGDDDWETSLAAVLATGADHVSTYGLTIEPGTKLAAQVRRGTVPQPDADVQARRYATADARLTAAGLDWYELASWTRADAARCRHNVGYWRSHDWWGVGPGAHSHVAGTRWWNVAHPAEYAKRLGGGGPGAVGSGGAGSPARAREELDADARRLERVMLELRLRDGLDTALADAAALDRLVADGLIDLHGGRAVLTLSGRQRADHVTEILA
ncbi:MAG: coproporphyrinogen oxidase [Solirubrobacterales bacterium]|nr:coproporphyrinogen oxidase [Solirubrobacterales bacterium]